jgi:hypothetical protein
MMMDEGIAGQIPYPLFAFSNADAIAIHVAKSLMNQAETRSHAIGPISKGGTMWTIAPPYHAPLPQNATFQSLPEQAAC